MNNKYGVKLAVKILTLVCMCTVLTMIACSKEEEEEKVTTVEWVDMGLPSGLLWNSCNLGSAAPEEYGNYYAWGETEPKTFYSWSNYKYTNGNYDQLTKYCNDSILGYEGYADTLTTLQTMDDAAAQILGNGARMPTLAEWQELWDSTSVEWTTKNGVCGMKLTSRTNGNSLFFPASGRRWGGALDYVGNYGSYWTSTCDEAYMAGAFFFYFGPDYDGLDEGYFRYNGLSIRPVHDSQN